MIITISRQFGSGGRTIGKRVAKELGIPCYDSEIVEKEAQALGIPEEEVNEKSQYTGIGSWFSASERTKLLYGESVTDKIWAAQCSVIRNFAEKGDAVFIGRCADYILSQDGKDLLAVYIYADEEYREKRIVKQYGETEDSPEKRIREKDKRRSAYYRVYTDQTFGDPQNYDICLNAGELGEDRCVEIIKHLYSR